MRYSKMGLIDKRCATRLDKFNVLNIAFSEATAAFDILESELIGLKLAKYSSKTYVSSSASTLGNASNEVYSLTRLPYGFEKDNAQLIKARDAAFEIMDKAELALITGRNLLLDEAAHYAAKDLIKHAKALEQAHAKIYAIGKNQKCLNILIWRDLRVPATVSYGDLNKISDKPNGRNMLCYPNRSDVLVKEYDSEIVEIKKPLSARQGLSIANGR